MTSAFMNEILALFKPFNIGFNGQYPLDIKSAVHMAHSMEVGLLHIIPQPKFSIDVRQYSLEALVAVSLESVVKQLQICFHMETGSQLPLSFQRTVFTADEFSHILTSKPSIYDHVKGAVFKKSYFYC